MEPLRWVQICILSKYKTYVEYVHRISIKYLVKFY